MIIRPVWGAHQKIRNTPQNVIALVYGKLGYTACWRIEVRSRIKRIQGQIDD
jgi:hypothetical protein